VPGLSDLPILGRLFGKTHKETQQTDIILTLTPHIVAVLDLNEADLRPFRLGREAPSTPALLESPVPAVQPEPQPTQPPAPGQRPILPIRPPEPPPTPPTTPPTQTPPVAGSADSWQRQLGAS
jgi:general secretion pathway protein D